MAYTVFGAALILAALWDIFESLFQPGRPGFLSRVAMQRTWRFFRRLGHWHHGFLVLAGPAILMLAILNWVLLLAVGFGLIYWPQLREGFNFASELHPESRDDLVDTLYFSLVTLATLGYGDIVPTARWLRILAPLQAMVGIGLLTAALTWILSTYPVITRRLALTREILLLRDARRIVGRIADVDEPVLERTLADLTSRLVVARGDLEQFAVTYYFHPADERASLAAALPFLLDVTREVEADPRISIRFRAAALRSAIDGFAGTVSGMFLGKMRGSTEEILTAYARDHLPGAAHAHILGEVIRR